MPRQKNGATGAAFDKGLFGKLLHAFYWMDDGLQVHMMREAGLSLPRAQSMMMACIADGVTQQSEMAKYLRVSKQAVQQSLKELVAKEFVTVEADPKNGRQKIVAFTDNGSEMREIARAGILALEEKLASRIGAAELRTLHEVLDADWGSVEGSRED